MILIQIKRTGAINSGSQDPTGLVGDDQINAIPGDCLGLTEEEGEP